MARSRHPGKKVMQHQGFVLPSGTVFEGQNTISKILGAIFGDKKIADYPDIGDATQKVEDTLTILFHHLVDRAELYCALRGHEAFYATLAAEFPSDGSFTGDLIKILEETFVTAHRANPASETQSTSLTRAADAWIQVKDTAASIPPLRSYSLTARPTEMGALTSQLQGATIHAATNWPPNYFDPYDVAIISMNQLRPLLFGKTPKTPGALPTLPNKDTTPCETRGFLCSLALMNYEPNSIWKLTLAPIAQFPSHHDAWLWGKATGDESRLCLTMEKHMSNTVKAFGFGKNISIALATPWFGRPWGAVPSVSEIPAAVAAGQTQQALWSSLCPRLGFAIALRKYTDGVELILFDPTRNYNRVKNSAYVKANQTAIFAFRQLIRESAEEAARAAGGRLVRGWWGGKLEMGDDADSVQLASEWIRHVVVAGREKDPFAVDDGVWAQWGFEEIQM